MTEVSLKTAKRTGLTIPLNVLKRAELADVIEQHACVHRELKRDQIHGLVTHVRQLSQKK
jgi:hypothetical protein